MKKWSIRSYLSGIVTAVLVLGLCVPAIAATVQKQMTATYKDIKIYVDGQKITPKDVNGNIVEPFVSGGTTYLPVRAVGEALGKEVTWDGTTNSVYIGEKPDFVSTAERTVYSLGGLQYSIDSSWVSRDSTNSRYHYAKLMGSPLDGYVYVQNTDLETNVSDKTTANTTLDALMDGFKSTDSISNLVSGEIETIAGHYAKCGSFDFISNGVRYPSKVAFILDGSNAYAISAMIQESASQKLDKIFSDIIASVQFPGSESNAEKTYEERLEAVKERALNGEEITYAKYSQIRTGMTYIEVAEIIGDLGTIAAQSNGITIRTWDNSNYGVASIVFTDGKVSAKSQAGL